MYLPPYRVWGIGRSPPLFFYQPLKVSNRRVIYAVAVFGTHAFVSPRPRSRIERTQYNNVVAVQGVSFFPTFNRDLSFPSKVNAIFLYEDDIDVVDERPARAPTIITYNKYYARARTHTNIYIYRRSVYIIYTLHVIRMPARSRLQASDLECFRRA